MHVGQPIIAALQAERQAFVIQAQQVQQRRVEVMHMHRILDRVDPRSSELPWTCPAFTPPPASHIEKQRL